MPIPYDEQFDLNLVKVYLEARGLAVDRMPARKKKKTTDFQIRQNGAIVA
jgi:hypothetical protein